MTEPRRLEREALQLLHAESLVRHGGLVGIRDEGRLESALARPANLHAYEGETDVLALAACYGIAVAKNHPFMDGNKRAAFLAMLLFAETNGHRIVADPIEAAAVMFAVAAGELDQAGLAKWLRAQAQPKG